MVEHRVLTDQELEEHDRLAYYGTPIADTPDPKTGLSPNEEQVARNPPSRPSPRPIARQE